MDEYLNMLVQHLDRNVNLFASVLIGKLSSDSKSIAIRLMPTAPGDRFQNKDRTRAILFQVLTKSTSQIEALVTLESISEALDSIDVLTYTEPNYLEDNGKEWIYTAAYRGELIKEMNSIG